MKDTSTCRTISKKKFLCRIAGLVYEIEYSHDHTKKVFADYIIEEALPDEEIIPISYTEKDLEEILKIAEAKTETYKEYVCIFDKIASMLPNFDMILMHGAAIEYEGEGFLFTAPSGTGKSTHIMLWKKYLGDKVTIINGDKPELSFKDDDVIIHGAPWCGKEGWQTNKSVPLKGICLVRRGTENKIEKISAGEEIEFFIQQLYFEMQDSNVLKVFDIFDRIVNKVPFYILECDISQEAAKCSFEAMTGKEWRISDED